MLGAGGRAWRISRPFFGSRCFARRYYSTLAGRTLEDDSLEQAERFFLLVEQGRRVEKFEPDSFDRGFDFWVGRDVADFCEHALSFRADDVVVEEQRGVRV